MGHALSGGSGQAKPAALTVFYYLHNCLLAQSATPGHPQHAHTFRPTYALLHTHTWIRSSQRRDAQTHMSRLYHGSLSYAVWAPTCRLTPHTTPTGMAHRATKQQEVYFYIFYTYLISLGGSLWPGNTYRWSHCENAEFHRLIALLQLWYHHEIRKLCCTYWYKTAITQPVSFALLNWKY